MAPAGAQRAALARRPKPLSLDEPFLALDAFTRARLQAHVLALWEKTGLAILLVTHDLDEAVALSDRIVALGGQPGRVVGPCRVGPARRRSVELEALRDRVPAALDLDSVDEEYAA